MKLVTVLLFSILSQMAYADLQMPLLCSSTDYIAMHNFFVEMEKNGFDATRIQKRIGMRGGDCLNPYSLEDSAGRPHKMDSPKPSCGIIFVLDSTSEAEQAAWILDSINSIHLTVNGRGMRICSEVSEIGSQ